MMNEQEWEPGRWWRVTYDDPITGKRQVWCESSNQAECRQAMKTAPAGSDPALFRIYATVPKTEWRQMS